MKRPVPTLFAVPLKNRAERLRKTQALTVPSPSKPCWKEKGALVTMPPPENLRILFRQASSTQPKLLAQRLKMHPVLPGFSSPQNARLAIKKVRRNWKNLRKMFPRIPETSANKHLSSKSTGYHLLTGTFLIYAVHVFVNFPSNKSTSLLRIMIVKVVACNFACRYFVKRFAQIQKSYSPTGKNVFKLRLKF